MVFLKPLVRPLFDLFLPIPIALLEPAFILVVPAFDVQQIVIGEFAPFLLEFAFELLPASRELVLVQDNSKLGLIQPGDSAVLDCGGDVLLKSFTPLRVRATTSVVETSSGDMVGSAPRLGSNRVLRLVIPIVRPARDFFLLVAVSFLERAIELVEIALDLGQVVVRKVAPFPLEFAFELIPFAFELIGVHARPPFSELSRCECDNTVVL